MTLFLSRPKLILMRKVCSLSCTAVVCSRKFRGDGSSVQIVPHVVFHEDHLIEAEVTVHSLAHRHVHIVGDDAKVELVQQLGMSEKILSKLPTLKLAE
jgi:hypothetical protein